MFFVFYNAVEQIEFVFCFFLNWNTIPEIKCLNSSETVCNLNKPTFLILYICFSAFVLYFPYETELRKKHVLKWMDECFIFCLLILFFVQNLNRGKLQFAHSHW